MSNYCPVIGLEIHCQLATKTKMFCGCEIEVNTTPNKHVCPVCLGMPGAMPVPNKKAVEYAIRLGLALNCERPLADFRHAFRNGDFLHAFLFIIFQQHAVFYLEYHVIVSFS